ncbi:MAG: ATP-binding protein [Bacteroidetes bacterium CHB5]|nr:ATP-binding protein [Bacteroidetes bacterium CHB5]
MLKTGEKYVSRPVYINRVKPFIGQNLIKVLVGQRRVGKSYLLLQLMDTIRASDKNANIIYINKELFEFDDLRNHQDLMKWVSEKSKPGLTNYLFIDEIQDIENFEKAIRSLQAKDSHDIYITGSNAFLLSGELATYLSGRYVEFKIYGLSFNEFINFHNKTNSVEAFNQYLKYGGLPYLINLELKDELVYEYLKNIYAAILFKDVVARHNIRNVSLLENLVSYIADNTGSLLSAKSISDFLKSQRIKVSPNVILDYLSYLEQAFFILKANREELQGKKIFVIGQKYYLEDLGLRHALIGYRGIDIGKILENVVYLHLLMAGYTVRIGTLQKKEVDFVCTRGDEKIYVQVAYLISDENTMKREFGNLDLIQDNYPKYVVSLDQNAAGNVNGINHVNIREFISQLI